MRKYKKNSKRIILILGGARSGKSTYAQKLASEISDNVLFVATAEPLDEEMKKRISAHRRQRPRTWTTIETPYHIAEKIEGLKNSDLILIDCITLLVSNILGKEIKPEKAEKTVLKELDSLISTVTKLNCHCIMVSNEVGMGIVPENHLARIYRDLLGKVNQIIAANATEVYFMTVGIPLKIK